MTPDSSSQTWLYLDRDMPQPELLPVAGGPVWVLSARCPTKQSPNEDSAAVISLGADSAVLAVADGMGGGQAGEQASRLALESLERAVVESADEDVTLRDAILNGIEQANQAVRTMGIGAATTLAAVEIQDHAVRPYHVGDAAVLLVGQRGKIKFQTISHSPVGFAVESGELAESEAMWHEDRSVVSNVVGDENMRIDLGPPLKFAPRDTLLLATDGLFDNLYLEEIVNMIRKGPLAQAATSLAQTARQRMTDPTADLPAKPDDLTFVLFRRHA